MVMLGEPWAKKRPRISQGGGRTHQPKDDRDAETRTHEQLTQLWLPFGGPFTENVMLGARFFRSTRGTVDLDNLLKHLLDAATGVFWINDCQVTAYDRPELLLDRERPRTELWLAPHFNVQLLNRQYDLLTGKVAK